MGRGHVCVHEGGAVQLTGGGIVRLHRRQQEGGELDGRRTGPCRQRRPVPPRKILIISKHQADWDFHTIPEFACGVWALNAFLAHPAQASAGPEEFHPGFLRPRAAQARGPAGAEGPLLRAHRPERCRQDHAADANCGGRHRQLPLLAVRSAALC